MKIFPNPVDDHLFIASITDTAISISLYDAIGRLALTTELQGQQSSIDMSGLKPGLYLVEVRSSNGLKYQKVVKNM